MENMTVREGHQVKKGKKAILALLLTGSVLAGGVGTMTILAENGKDTPPAMGEFPFEIWLLNFLQFQNWSQIDILRVEAENLRLRKWKRDF